VVFLWAKLGGDMIEIYVGGNTCYECDMSLQSMYLLMTEEYIPPDAFIEITEAERR
jgi:hypothetical protein